MTWQNLAVKGWGSEWVRESLGDALRGLPDLLLCPKNQGYKAGWGRPCHRLYQLEQGTGLPSLSFLPCEMGVLMTATLQACHDDSVRQYMLGV